MEYKTKSAKLEDIVTKTVDIYATAAELGSISAGNLAIAAADISDDLETADVFLAQNLTLSEALSPSVASGTLTLDGASAISASNKLHVVIRLK